MRLEEQPLDIGYASEKVTLKAPDGTSQSVGGQDGKTHLIVTVPFIDDNCIAELQAIGKALPKADDVTASLIVAATSHEDPKVEGFRFLLDSDEEFADWYGVRLSGEPLDGELTKALFIISKDGALYYDEFARNLHDPFNAETAVRKVYAAQECYTGKGCH
ncbi:redoxin family protein [Sulfurimonas sp. HSL-1656]|uniref:redoxin family protein n=1 Tax=Thiomicrolovo subterrani TaxID=3131934 RepID=UPI0031F754A9